MIANGQFVAELIMASAPGLAALSAQRLLEQRPGVAARLGPDARSHWRRSTVSRLEYLSAALSTGSPAVFAEQLSWARIAHEARGGAEVAADFDAAMQSLRSVLIEELPGHPGTLAASYIDAAMDPKLALGRPSELSTPHRRLVAEFLVAVLEGDRRRASQSVLAALEASPDHPGLSVPEIYLDVLVPAQFELGRMWHLNEIGVAEEHFATATTQLIMAQLYSRLPCAPFNGKVVVAASVEGNAHDIAVRMLGDLLESEGWRTIYLGASVPAQDLASAVEHFKADLVAISAGLGSQLPAVGEAIRHIRGQARSVKVLVGGGAFPAATGPTDESPLWRRLGADAFASDLRSGLSVAAQLLGLPA